MPESPEPAGEARELPLSLSRGMSLSQFQTAVGAQLARNEDAERKSNTPPTDMRHSYNGVTKHQFTVSADGKTVLCVASRISEYPLGFYVVFENDKLERILVPPPFEYEERPYQDSSGQVSRIRSTKAADPQERVDLVLREPGLSIQEAVELAKHRYEAHRAKVDRHSEPLPIPKDLWDLSEGLDAARRSKEQERYVVLREKYDGLRIDLGMALSDVESGWGSAIHVQTVSEHEIIHIFGTTDETGRSPVPRIAVTFLDGKVSAVYSESFYDPQATLGGKPWVSRGSSR